MNIVFGGSQIWILKLKDNCSHENVGWIKSLQFCKAKVSQKHHYDFVFYRTHVPLTAEYTQVSASITNL